MQYALFLSVRQVIARGAHRKRGCQNTHPVVLGKRWATRGHGRIGGGAMVADLSKARIFLRTGITDMRKAVNGFTAIVQEEM